MLITCNNLRVNSIDNYTYPPIREMVTFYTFELLGYILLSPERVAVEI